MSTLTAVPSAVGIQSCRPRWMILTLILTDVCSLTAAGIFAVLLRSSVVGFQGIASCSVLVPFLLLLILVYSALGLYSGVSLSSPEELRRSTLACISIFWSVAATAVFLPESRMLFSWTTAVAMLFSIVAVPVARELVRLRYSRSAWWGYPVVVLGDEQSGKRLIRTLNQQTDLGLKPVALICSELSEADQVCGVPVINEDELSDWEPVLKGRGYALLTGAAESRERLRNIIVENRKLFPHVLIVPETWEFSCFWVSPKNLGGLLGLEIREQIFQPSKQFLKRMLDLLLTSFIFVVTAPLFLLIALAIKIDSPGPAFYSQRRVGRGGVEFRAWKFRSMVRDADALLARYLDEHPELAIEWKQNHKLRYDPRITRIGSFLRKSSLDEIPQLWNVIRGDMSLVGPRPIVRDEIPRYGKHFGLYASVQSGLTGLWQVSGRSETSYEQRVHFDAFYVRNWSVWLDLCILFRTIGVLCLRTGAY